jgi:hypothetical protein
MRDNPSKETSRFGRLINAVRSFPRREFSTLARSLDWRGGPFECLGILSRYISLWLRVSCAPPIVIDSKGEPKTDH